MVVERSAERWDAVVAIAVGIFTLVAVEELPIGVLTLMSDDLNVTPGIAGLSVTLPGVIAGAVALAAPSITRGRDRRLVLVAALVVVAISCVATAVSWNITSLLAARALAGIPVGLYWAIMPIAAAGQVSERRTPLALTIVYAGVGAALVFGLPLATWLGDVVGWRTSFLAVAALALIVALMLQLRVMPVIAHTAETIRSTLAAFRIRGIRYPVILSVVIVGGTFITYSYIRPILLDIAAVPALQISLFLMVYGVLGLVGNFAAGPIIARSPATAVLILAAGTGLSMLAMLLVMSSPLSAMIIMVAWGLIAGMASVTMQSMVQSGAGERLDAGTALNSAAFSTSIALGALIGGQLVDHLGLRAPLWTSMVCMLAAVLIVLQFLRGEASGGAKAGGRADARLTPESGISRTLDA